VSPAHHSGHRRWVSVAVIAVVLAGVGVAARSPGTSLPGGPPPAPAALVGAPDAESSAWYCTGQTTAAGQLAPGSVVLTNTGTRRVSGTIHAVTDTGATVYQDVSVPGRGQLVADVPAPKSGTWLSEAVTLSRGGVAVSQTLHGPAGWAEAPCQSTTAQQWYFPSGLTTGTSSLFVSLFNPTSTPDVVDLSFVTTKGVVHPINFQGIVLGPGQTQVESVAPYVQDQPAIATTVSTRTGRLVANELQLLSDTSTGLAIVPGSPHAENVWALPQNEELNGGSSSVDIFNPGPTTQEVTVRARLASGALAPFKSRVPPETTWLLITGAQTRIPKGDPYSLVIRAQGGGGVVVGRVVGAPASATVPQNGLANGVNELSADLPSRRWVVPSPGSRAAPATPGAAPEHLGLTNLSAKRETYVVEVIRPGGLQKLASGTLPTETSVSLGTALLSRAGLNPLVVRASGATAVSEDLGPGGTYGVVTMPGIPLSLPLSK
jgi:hypothetical protein